MLLEFGQANLIQKARQQPEKVRQVLDKMKTDGVLPTVEAVFRKLDEPIPLGYCNAGVVLEVGEGVTDLSPGDRVASNGPHAEIVCVPRHLCARIPDGVSDEASAYTVMGAIALQGVRLANPTFGETFLVFGMGLLGLLTVQLLRASGSGVIAVDLNSSRLALAREFGAEVVDLSSGGDPVRAAMETTKGVGVDGAIITASAKTDSIMHDAAQACRKRGRIVLVGVVGLGLQRSDFYEKELTFQVSCSYGPGRYDEKYEEGGQDYPIGFVRWTEQRNFEAILDAMAKGSLNVEKLTTHRFPFDRALEAYEEIQQSGDALGVVLEFSGRADARRTVAISVDEPKGKKKPGKGRVAVIGAGGFAKAVILPALQKAGADILYLAGRSHTATLAHTAQKFGARKATTDLEEVWASEEVDSVFILTGHHTHAALVVRALEAGKHVFVEKPLAITEEQLDEVMATADRHPELHLMVGFNRRFSPHVRKMQELLKGRSGPLCMTMTVNAGAIPADSWIHDPARGGGRIIGEGCHFIDLMVALSGALVEEAFATSAGSTPRARSDNMSISLRFADGSIGSVNYFANGSKAYPKETMEVFSDGRVLRLENFRTLRGWGFKGFQKFSTLKQDKGHQAEVEAFLEVCATPRKSLIRLGNLKNVSLEAIQIARGAI